MQKDYLLGGESNPGLPRDRRRYSPLYYRGSQHVGQTERSDCYTLPLLIEKKKAVPVRGIEPRPRRWERRILTTRPRGSWCSLCGFYQSYSFSHQVSIKAKEKMFSPGIEPGTLWSLMKTKNYINHERFGGEGSVISPRNWGNLKNPIKGVLLL